MDSYNLLLLLLLVPVIRGCVDNWPKSCCSNYRLTETGCERCEPGTYGTNCSEPCPDGHYGEGCFYVCHCTQGELCDKEVGCIKWSTQRNGSNVCDCTEEEVCDERVGCVKTSAPKSESTADIGLIITAYSISSLALGTTKAQFNSTKEREAHVRLDGVHSNDVIIIGSSLVLLCIISVIGYLCYSKRIVNGKRRQRGRAHLESDVRNTAEQFKEDQCIYSKISSISVQESTLPLAIPDPLCDHKDDPIYHTLSLRLDLRDEKYLDPICSCTGPRKPHSVSNINVHSAYEEPLLNFNPWIRSHSEGESDFSIKTKGGDCAEETSVDVPQKKSPSSKITRNPNQDDCLKNEFGAQDRNFTESEHIENPYSDQKDKRILKKNLKEHQSTLQLESWNSAFVHQNGKMNIAPEDADLVTSKEDNEIQISDVCEQEETKVNLCPFINTERDGSQTYQDVQVSLSNNSLTGTAEVDKNSETNIIDELT